MPLKDLLPTIVLPRRWRAFCAAIILGLLIPVLGAQEKKQYRLPSGQAVKTLKMAASQGEAQILYAVRMVKGVETKRVRGYYSLREVLDRMLEDTPLEAVQDDKSRSYIIKPRAEKGGEVPERSENEPPIIEKTETQMNLEDTSILRIVINLSIVGRVADPAILS